MANTRILQDRQYSVGFVVQKDEPRSRIIFNNIVTRLINLFPLAKRFEEKHFANTRIDSIDYNTLISEDLPFRVRFTNKGVLNYGPGNPPPIGVAVIGTNNYIL